MRVTAVGSILGIVAAVTGFVGTGHAHALSQKGVGAVIGVRGEVSVSHTAAGSGRPAREALRFRDDVFFRDVIDTQRDSGAKLLLKGRAVFTVRELSRVELREGTVPPDSGRTRSIVQVLAGAARALVQRDLLPHNEIEIHTPNAVSAIRGTELITEVFLPGQPVPPLPSVDGDGRPQPGGAMADVVSRYFVRKGLIEVEWILASGGQGIEKVGNRPPRLFAFVETTFEAMAARFAVPSNAPSVMGTGFSGIPAVAPNALAVPSGVPALPLGLSPVAPTDGVSPSKVSVPSPRSVPPITSPPTDMGSSRISPDSRPFSSGPIK